MINLLVIVQVVILQDQLDYVITVCNNANNEVCPIWPDKNQIIHWDIEDPVKKFNVDNDATN